MKLNIKPRNYYIAIITFLILSVVFTLGMVQIFGIFPNNDQTFVGSIAISNYDESRYESIIKSKLLKWEENSTYTISYQNVKYDIPLNLLDADVKETVNNIQKNTMNSVVYSISDTSKNQLYQELSTIYSQPIVDVIDFDSLYSGIIDDASNMEPIHTYYLENYLEETALNIVLSSMTLSNIDSGDITSIIDNVTSIDIPANSRFYLLESMQPYTLSNEQLSIIASGILGVSLGSHFTGFMFQQNTAPPSWSEQGMNVRILQANHYDFSLFNPYKYSLSVRMTQSNETSILFELIGFPYIDEYTTSITSVTSIPFSTTYIQNDLIDETTPGVIVTETDEEYIYHLPISAGVNGEIIEIRRTTTDPEGTSSSIVLFYETYQAVNAVFEENSVDKGVS